MFRQSVSSAVFCEKVYAAGCVSQRNKLGTIPQHSLSKKSETGKTDRAREREIVPTVRARTSSTQQ